jgi:hypothetical protein
MLRRKWRFGAKVCVTSPPLPPTLENVGSCAELSPICFDVANGLLLVAAPVGWPPPSVLFGLGRQASSGGVTLAEYGERWCVPCLQVTVWGDVALLKSLIPPPRAGITSKTGSKLVYFR